MDLLRELGQAEIAHGPAELARETHLLIRVVRRDAL
jgi:hypothetical protein